MSSSCTRRTAVTAHQPRASLLLSSVPEKKQKNYELLCLLLSALLSMGNAWWMVWHFQPCLFGCFTAIRSSVAAWMPGVIGTKWEERDRTLHAEKSEDRHSHRVIKHSRPSLTFSTWARYRHVLQWHSFISVLYTGPVNLNARVLDLSQPRSIMSPLKSYKSVLTGDSDRNPQTDTHKSRQISYM